MKQIFYVTLSVFALSLLFQPVAVRGQAPNVNNAKIFMGQKLDHTQRIFNAMIHGDFAGIQKNASAMAGFKLILEKYATSNIPGYSDKMRDFQTANSALIAAANARNMDDVSLAYATLSLSCVQCHQALRGH